jgi:hypothetical protein
MENNERDRKLEQWLDEALSEYSAAEPRLGLEQRVLARARAEEQTRAGRRSWWRWMPAFAAIAAVLIVAVAVMPYWESKTAPKQEISPYISAPQASSERMAREQNSHPAPIFVDKGGAANEKKSASTAILYSRSKEATAMKRLPIPTKDADAGEMREAEVQPMARTVPTSRAYRNANDLAVNSNAPAKESDAVSEDAKKQSRTYPSVVAKPTVPPAPAAQASAPASGSGAAGGAVRGAMGGMVVMRGRLDSVKAAPTPQVADTANAVPARSETVEVQSAVPIVQAQNGIIATQTIAVQSATTKTQSIKLKPSGALAKKRGQEVRKDDGTGYTLLSTELNQVPPGPVQKFPTPVPLSKEEEMMLAAAKQLKGKPANEEKSDGGIPAIEIKKVEIAPLAGPPK